MQLALRTVVSHVHQTAKNISGASLEFAQGNDALARRTEPMDGSLQRTASAMGEMASTIRQTASAAQHADQQGTTAARAAAGGSALVARVLATM